MARLSVSAGGLLGEYKSCRDRKGQLHDERAQGREELRRIRSVVKTRDTPLCRRMREIPGNYADS